MVNSQRPREWKVDFLWLLVSESLSGFCCVAVCCTENAYVATEQRYIMTIVVHYKVVFLRVP